MQVPTVNNFFVMRTVHYVRTFQVEAFTATPIGLCEVMTVRGKLT